MTRQIIKTVCQMCYFYCGLDVTVENGRITRVEGMSESPVNQGRLCVKGLASPQLVSDPNRIMTPLRRAGERGSGRWERVTWDQAIGEISDKMLSIRESLGPEYVGYYRGQAPGWVTNFNYVWRFMNSWGSPNLFTHSHLCFEPRALAHGATFGRFPEPDYENTECILLVGYNPVYTSPVNYHPGSCGQSNAGRSSSWSTPGSPTQPPRLISIAEPSGDGRGTPPRHDPGDPR